MEGQTLKNTPDLLELRDEGVDHALDLRCFRREQDQFLARQIQLQHVRRRDGDEEDVRVPERTIKRSVRYLELSSRLEKRVLDNVHLYDRRTRK